MQVQLNKQHVCTRIAHTLALHLSHDLFALFVELLYGAHRVAEGGVIVLIRHFYSRNRKMNTTTNNSFC